MARLSLGSDGETLGALRRLLAARGLDERDFEIEEDRHSGISQLLGMAGGIVSLRRRSTGEMRVYAAGPGSAWYAAICADLELGYFRAATPATAFRRQPQARSTFTSTSSPTTARPATTPTASHMSVPLLLRRWLPLTTGAT